MSLFAVEPVHEHLFPGSFEKAQHLATNILRSKYHCTKFCQFYQDKEPGTQHIHRDDLNSLLKECGIFKVDKIRLTEYLGARACTQCEIDPFRIYLNPLMLLEMAEKERESNELEKTPLSEWPCLMNKVSFWRDESFNEHKKRVNAGGDEFIELEHPNTEHEHIRYNSLVVINQRKEVDLEKKQQKRQRDADMAQKKSSAAESDKQPARASRQKRTLEVFAAGPAKAAKLDAAEPAPSTMTVVQKHVLMLTVLLVHEAQNLLMYALNDALDPVTGETPKKKFDDKDEEPFADVGHCMERGLYGYCIHHAPSRYYSTPFGVDEVLGSTLQRAGDTYILQPVPRFLALLDNPECQENIEAADLQLVRTCDVPYTVPQAVVRLGRNLFCGSTGSGTPDSDDEEFEAEFAEMHPDYTYKGKA